MLKIPYIPAPENACALACYTMTVKYFFPEVTFKEIARISNWTPKFVVWPFKFWKWILDKGIKVTDYDLINYKDWGEHGASGLKNSLVEKEFNWVKANSTDLDELGKDIKGFFEHKNFKHLMQKPSFSELEQAVSGGKVCEVVLNSHVLDRIKGFALHRVVVTDINNDIITFHDPRLKPRPNRQENKEHFIESWLDTVSDPEICIYSK